MAEQRPASQGHQGHQVDKKRKRPLPPLARSAPSNKRPKVDYRSKQRDARQLSTQTTSTALQNGELDVDKFVKAREYEIQALEDGMVRSKKALNRRAFQQVPKDLRRRTASHNVKKVPKRLRARAQREMVEDNTPTVTARRRKPTRHMRLRLDIVKKLRAAGAKRKTEQNSSTGTAIATRAPRVKKATLATPPLPKAKFRKRQIHKSWLPTHLFHAKRAHMTPPSRPLWRFSIPLSPTIKSYRPTHRASLERGAVAWDMSYMATIGLEGRAASLENVLKGLQVGMLSDEEDPHVWGKRGAKWRAGLRVIESFAFERETPKAPIAPVSVIWCAPSAPTNAKGVDKAVRKVLMRVHPSAFLQLWEELLRLAKTAKPSVSVEDLRFELGSIEIQGPGSTEALLGALWPTGPDSEGDERMVASQDVSVEDTWTSLSGLTDCSLVPPGALLGFSIQDPRLHFPPRTIAPRHGRDANHQLLTTCSSWPVDTTQAAPTIFDRRSRVAAGAALSSQKAINRRKSLADPGKYPSPLANDPHIPVLLYTTPRHSSENKHRPQAQTSSWTILLPWKCVQPVWYSLMYYPLSSGQQPRFGGLDEKRQICFEACRPWFPADFPGTKTGWDWELEDRAKRYAEWKRHPKGKRVNWDKVDLGSGTPGEAGRGWACDWERLLGEAASGEQAQTEQQDNPPAGKPKGLISLSKTQASRSISADTEVSPNPVGALITVRLNLLSRGVPQACARIYRLPSNDPELRKAWLQLQPSQQGKRIPKNAPARLPKDAPAHVLQRRLAASLLEPPKIGDDMYPRCPGEDDLIGFITTGNFNLSQGQGTGIGSILLTKVWDNVRGNAVEGKLCIIRNAGHNAGRLARWEIAE